MGWISDLGSALSGVITGTIGSATSLINTPAGASLMQGVAAKMGATVGTSGNPMASSIPTKPIGEGYTTPLTSTMFNFYELNAQKMYVLDASFNRKLNWGKILGLGGVVTAVVFYLKKKRFI